MSEQDSEGPDDLWSAIAKSATSGHNGPNDGRVLDGCIFVTEREWQVISELPASRTWDDITAVEKLQALPIRIVRNGAMERLSDARIILAFADKLYLLTEPEFKIPPLSRLHIDGRYI